MTKIITRGGVETTGNLMEAILGDNEVVFNFVDGTSLRLDEIEPAMTTRLRNMGLQKIANSEINFKNRTVKVVDITPTPGKRNVPKHIQDFENKPKKINPNNVGQGTVLPNQEFLDKMKKQAEKKKATTAQ